MILILSSQFDKSEKNVVQTMEQDAIDFLIEHDQAVEVHHVPGAVEIPVAIQHFLEHDPEKFSVVIALGLVIKGDTDHYELVCRSCVDGMTRIALDFGIPVVQGVLACKDIQQALERKHMGKEFAETALHMKRLFQS